MVQDIGRGKRLLLVLLFFGGIWGIVRIGGYLSSFHSQVPSLSTLSMNRTRNLALAALNVTSRDNRFPAAYVSDEQGRRMHSWRVELLPFLEENEIYDAYNFEELWDGPNNRQLPIPYIYQSPYSRGRSNQPDPYTAYTAIVGSKTFWPGAQRRPFDDPAVRERLSETIFIAEYLGKPIHWAQPDDLELETMSFRLHDKTRPSIGNPSGKNAIVAMGDGAVRRVEPEITPAQLRRMIVIDELEPESQP